MNKKIKTKFGNAVLNKEYYMITTKSEGHYGKALHRAIFEEFYGMEIPTGYVIHHKNGIKTDNCILNLQMLPESEHHSLHMAGENHPMYGKNHSEESKQKMRESQLGIPISLKTQENMSKKQNTTGYFRVSKMRSKQHHLGYYWVYQYYEDGKHKRVSAGRMDKLKEKVLSKGLIWKIIDLKNAKQTCKDCGVALV